MSDVPPTESASNSGALRVVTILVMLASILGLLGTGFCAIAVIGDGLSNNAGEALAVLSIAVPPLLFFTGAIWVCKGLLDRLKK